MRVMRWLAGLCLVAATGPVTADAAEGAAYQKASFYYAAHQDDWQLFMNPSAFLDVADAKTKAVFVHTTAGDAGLGIGKGGKRYPYYLARENGAEAAIRFMVDADSEPGARSASYVQINGHSIYRVAYRNTVSYFLRLPDGNAHGTGYYDTGYRSLRRLASGDNASISAVDGSAVYHGWRDLVATLRALLDSERGSAQAVQLNVAELDASLNPEDHSDHLMTARAALDSAAGLACARRISYVDYASAHLPENLSPQHRDLGSAVFAITSAGVRALGHNNNWRWYDQAYLGRNYFRIEEGRGGCEPAPPVQAIARVQQRLRARPVALPQR
jgi:hypothetical protein